MMRLGPDDGPVVVVALPLFEEANRTRVVAVEMMRALDGYGIASVLPDLPGQGDSQVPLETVSLLDLRHAHRAATSTVRAGARSTFCVSIRGGALVDALSVCHGRWHLAPQDGPSLLRELARIKQAGSGARLSERWFAAGEEPDEASVAIAGNRVSPALLVALFAAVLPTRDGEAAPYRSVRLDGDPRPANQRLTGIPPWRKAEPGGDTVLSQALAGDIADWIRTCAAR